jgi:hypothetical protein
VSRGLPSLLVPRRLGRLPGGFESVPGFGSGDLSRPQAAAIPLPVSRDLLLGSLPLSRAATFGGLYSPILVAIPTMVAGSGEVLASCR